MKKIAKLARCATVFLLFLAMVSGAVTSAKAADVTTLETDQTGSVSLILEDSEGKVVTSGAITLYQVAALYLDNGSMAYAYTDAFSGCTAEPDVTNTALAAELAAYAAENAVSGTTAAVGEDGKVSFEDLELGLYLIVQTTDSDDYETINPFLVTLPMKEDGAWVYAVDASPKVGTLTETETETAPEEETETETTPEEETETETAPEEETESATTPEEETETETTAAVTTSDTTTPTTLPQTGQLNWPIPVLTICGLMLFLMGWRLRIAPEKRCKNAP
ncbi:MAG: hypothetical protein LUE29_05465 [Lachnospiraceae bacterium]|nr:hypothetical protein [Lachnospiraceae bacterium]